MPPHGRWALTSIRGCLAEPVKSAAGYHSVSRYPSASPSYRASAALASIFAGKLLKDLALRLFGFAQCIKRGSINVPFDAFADERAQFAARQRVELDAIP